MTETTMTTAPPTEDEVLELHRQLTQEARDNLLAAIATVADREPPTAAA